MNKTKLLGLLMATVILGAVIVVPGASACKIVKPEGYTKTNNIFWFPGLVAIMYIWCINQCNCCTNSEGKNSACCGDCFGPVCSALAP